MKTRKEKVSRKVNHIPKFKSPVAETEFWDKHSLADYWDEFKPVKVNFARNLSEVLPVRFDAETLDKLRAQARKKGIGPTTLVWMWVMERLDSQ